MPTEKSVSRKARVGRAKKANYPNRARFLIDQCPHRITGVMNIPGLQLHSPEHESSLERNAIKLFALCNDVAAIESQPETIQFSDANGKAHKYTTDLMVTLTCGEKIRVEVKPLAIALSGDTFVKLLNVSRHYASIGQQFHILSDDAISIEPRQSIATRLRSFLKQQVPPELKTLVEDSLKGGPKLIAEILEAHNHENLWGHITALIAQRHISISWIEPYSRTMQISLPAHPFQPLKYEDIQTSSRFYPLFQDMALGRRPSDQQLLAAALSQNRTVCLPSPMGIIGGIPKRALAVSRDNGCGEL